MDGFREILRGRLRSVAKRSSADVLIVLVTENVGCGIPGERDSTYRRVYGP